MITNLLVDALQFAYIQTKVEFVDFIITQYDISFDSIPQKIIDSVCYKKNIIKKIKDKSLANKYYKLEKCQSNKNNNNILNTFYL
jgi:hypothetical protein